MKIFKSLALFAFVAVVALAGCSKGGSSSTTTPTYPFLKATTTGAFALNFMATDTFLVVTNNTTATHPTLTIKGHTANGDVLDIFISKYPITTGDIAFDSVLASAYYTHFPTGGGVAKNGSVVITATSPNITGTFNFQCTDLTYVNGSFSVPAQ